MKKLTKDNLSHIATILSAEVSGMHPETILRIGQGTNGPSIVMSVSMLSDDSTLISAQTSYGYFEIHNVTGFVPVEPDEVIFVSEGDLGISGLVVGRIGSCSLFANVNRSLLTSDLTTIDPPLLLAAMQLGLADATIN